MKKVLITGVAGFIASNVLVHLVQKYPDIHFYGLDKISYCSDVANFEEIATAANFTFFHVDLLDQPEMEKIFSEHVFDAILHFAAYTHVDHSFGNSIEFTKNNVLATHYLLEFAKKYWTGSNKEHKFIFASSDEVYGTRNTICTEDSILDPTNPYAATKAAAEHIVNSYYHSFKLPIIITRGNNVFGPKQYPEKVIPRFILRLLKGEKCQIQGSGEQKRSFLHVYDVAKAFELILFHGVVGEIYNIGSEREISILEVAGKIIAVMKPNFTESHLEMTEDRHFNDLRYFISSSKLEALGWKQEITFEEGLVQTISWYSERKHLYLNTDKEKALNI